MFNDLNEIKLLGNMTAAPEIKQITAGNSVANFSIATNRRYKQGDEWKSEVTYHNIVVWGTQAERLADYAKKGTRIMVAGRINNRSWEKDGVKQYRTEIIADNIYLINGYNDTRAQQPQQPQQPDQSTNNGYVDIETL